MKLLEFLLLQKGIRGFFFFHVLLGVTCLFSNFILIAYFYFVLISLVSNLFRTKDFDRDFIITLSYLVSFEIIFRMTKASPIVPYELSKYLMFVLFLIAISKSTNKGKVGIFMLLLILPALFYDYSNKVVFLEIIFNILGVINICLAIIYFYKRKIEENQIQSILRCVILPLTVSLVYAFLKTPEYDEMEFSLGANFATTGGFGSNQVSTVFGLGMFLTYYLWNKSSPISGFRYIDLILLFLFAIQGLLSFSRGGMIGGVIGILILLIFSSRIKDLKRSRKNKRIMFIGAVILVLSALYVNKLSNGVLLQRYRGETNATLAGKRDVDLNTITTNRFEIFEEDLRIFNNYPFGAGIGASKHLRIIQNGTASHVEVSRLAAEHGYLGIFFFITLSLIPFFYLKYKYNTRYHSLFLALYFIAWYTTFHAATRTFVTPLLIGLSLLTIKFDESIISRK